MKKMKRFRYAKKRPKASSSRIYEYEYKWIKNPMPVIISNIKALNESSKKEKFKLNPHTDNHSNSRYVNEASPPAYRASRTCPNSMQLNINAPNTVPQPTMPISDFEKLYCPNPLTIKPNKGINGISQISYII